MTQIRLLLGYSLLVALLLGVAESESDQPWSQVRSIVVWFAHAAIGLLLMGVVTRLLEKAASPGWPDWLVLVVGGVVGAVVFTPMALILEYWFAQFGMQQSDIESLSGLLSPVILWEELRALALPFIGSWMLLNVGYQKVAAGSDVQPQQQDPDTPSTSGTVDGLIARLPIELGSDIQLIRSDLNYVHVHTSLGHAMVLYSLNRAAEELAPFGMLVHRSYWVAFTAVASAKRHAKGATLKLVDGTEIPISRRRQREVLERFGKGFLRKGGAGQATDRD